MPWVNDSKFYLTSMEAFLLLRCLPARCHHVGAVPVECKAKLEDVLGLPGLDGTFKLSPPIVPHPLLPAVIHAVLIFPIPLVSPVCQIYVPLVC